MSGITGTGDKIILTTHNQYSSPHLTPDAFDPSPLKQFNHWLSEALQPTDPSIPAVREPEAMALSTASAAGIPSTRMVLLKQADSTGFVFFTNYTSRKSDELHANPWASLCFYWKEVSRQIRVVGRVEKLSREDSSDYYQSRPRGSRIGAWASKQSTVIGESTLDERMQECKERFGEEGEVPCPDFWGGWRIVPTEVEFWAGQPSRLHDRFRYTLDESRNDNGSVWKIDRLSP